MPVSLPSCWGVSWPYPPYPRLSRIGQQHPELERNTPARASAVANFTMLHLPFVKALASVDRSASREPAGHAVAHPRAGTGEPELLARSGLRADLLLTATACESAG
jgi:hypothetical protein